MNNNIRTRGKKQDQGDAERLIRAIESGYLTARPREKQLANQYFRLCEKLRRPFVVLVKYRTRATVVVDSLPAGRPSEKKEVTQLLKENVDRCALNYGGALLPRLPLDQAERLAGKVYELAGGV